MTLTVLDGYCGAGGSSSGAEMVPGVRVRYALNHWDKAIATHNHNMPHVDHDRVDMTDEVGGDPRKYAATDIGWFSPECTPDFDKWTRPNAWCPRCEQVVRALYVEKPGKRRAMRYGQQYRYRCPQAACRGVAVHPYVLPAAAAIDWTLPAVRIGDRRDPLRPKTLARIEAGLRRYARPITPEAAGNTFERRPGVRAWPVDDPLKTLHTTASKAPTCPPLLVPSGGTWNNDATTVGEPMRTRTTRETEAVVVPPFLVPLRSGRPRTSRTTDPLATVVADGSNHALIEPLLVPTVGRDGVNAAPTSQPHRTQTGRQEVALVVPLRNNGVARPADSHPAPAFAAAGTHHALVMRNNTARGDQGQMSTPVDEPLRTLLAERRHSLIQWDDGHLIYGYDTGRPGRCTARPGRGRRRLHIPDARRPRDQGGNGLRRHLRHACRRETRQGPHARQRRHPASRA
jgi:DNA (cytosine-5)-methyltransferase 1